MLVLAGLFFSFFILAIQGSDCLCAEVNLYSDQNTLMVPNGTCAKITDRTAGIEHEEWYNVRYNNKTGWIQADKSKMTFSKCQDSVCMDVTNICAAHKSYCETYKSWAYENCRKQCNLCDLVVTTTMLPTTASTCKDLYDCKYLDSMSNICKDAASAKSYCPKYCNICDTGCLVGR